MNGDFFHCQPDDDVLVISIRCDVGSLANDLLGQDMRDIFKDIQSMDVPRVVIDFRQRHYFGSAMLEALLNIWAAVREKGGRMALYNVSGVGHELLNLSRFSDLWPICDSHDEAILAVHSGEAQPH